MLAPVLYRTPRMPADSFETNSGNARVLVADGESTTAGALAAALRQKLVDVDVASSAGEALRLLSRTAYEVAVMDLAIFESGGSEIAIHLNPLPQNARPVVLVTTESGRRPDLDPDLVQVVIRKPIRTGELAEMIRACIDNAPRTRGGSIEARRPPLDLQRD